MSKLIKGDNYSRVGGIFSLDNFYPKSSLASIEPQVKQPGQTDLEQKIKVEQPQGLVEHKQQELNNILQGVLKIQQSHAEKNSVPSAAMESVQDTQQLQNLEDRLTKVQNAGVTGSKPSKSSEQLQASKVFALTQSNRPRRRIQTQGNDTFGEKKVEYQFFKLSGKAQDIQKQVTRNKRQKVQDPHKLPVEVGKYYPQYGLVSPRGVEPQFSKYPFTPRNLPNKDEEALEGIAGAEDIQSQRSTGLGGYLSAKESKSRVQDNFSLTRPDPFEPRKLYSAQDTEKVCQTCVNKDTFRVMEPSWHLLIRQANHNHPECNQPRFELRESRKDITEGYYSAHDQRFVKSQSHMIHANDPDIAQVKFDRYASRKKTLFNITARMPLPVEGKKVEHGGLYYSRDNQSKFQFSERGTLPFNRTFVNKKEMLKHVDDVLKKQKTKRPVSEATQRKRQMRSENMQIITKLVCGVDI